MEILKVQNVVKKFGSYAACNDVSFSVKKGGIFGLLGPNGAGKTTMIRMITNISYPDSGSINLFGEPVSPASQNRIGYLPEERGLYKKMKVIEQLIYFGQLKGLKRAEAAQQAKLWLAKVGANGWENKKIQELSKGMQQKVQFVTTILHSPEFLILDEPFSGFDPINTELLKNIILELKSQGKTIILSTHVMAQVEELCDEICMINMGKVVLSGTVRDIKNSYGRNQVLIEFEGDGEFINKYDNISILARTNGRIEFKILNDTFKMNDFISDAVQNNGLIKFELNQPSMHEIFIDVVSKQGGTNVR